MNRRVLYGRLGGQAKLNALIRSLAPAAWFRQGVGITVTGSGVSQWDDQSGNGRHLLQGTDAARPALQGDGTILFNGTAHYLKTNAFTLNQPTWVLWVGKQVSWTAGDNLYDGNSANSMIAQQDTVSPRVRAFTAGGSAATVTTLAVGAYGVLSVVYNGAGSSIQHNLNAPATADFGAQNGGGFTLGATPTPTGYSNIAVKEVAIFPFAPSTALQARLIAGLMARHGVA